MKKAFFYLSLILGLASLAFAFAGLPGGYDTEPLLALGIIFLALTGLVKD